MAESTACFDAGVRKVRRAPFGSSTSTPDSDRSAALSAVGNQGMQSVRGPGGAYASGSDFFLDWSRYPALARVLPRAVVEGRASAAVPVPLRLLLTPQASFEDREVWEDFLANRRGGGGDVEGAALLRNEMMRRFFGSKLSLSDQVMVHVLPSPTPDGMTQLTFHLHGVELCTPDGSFGPAELAAFGDLDHAVTTVQRDAASVEMAAQLLDAIEALEEVATSMQDVHLEPEAFALNATTKFRHYALLAKKVLDDWQCRVGPALPQTAELIARYDQVVATAQDAASFMSTWHEEHTMESAGQANARRGAAVGAKYDVPVAAFWALVEAVETVGTLGAHDARTAIAEAYQAGDISWNEAAELVNKATRRALTTAAVAGALGPVMGRFSAGVLGGFNVGTRIATIGGGVIGGGITSASVLATQGLYTRVGGGNFSRAGQQIWDAGAPGARAYAIGVPFGMLTGGLQAAKPPPVPATPTGPGFFGKAAIWARLRFGEPMMAGAHEGMGGWMPDIGGARGSVPALVMNSGEAAAPAAVSAAPAAAAPYTVGPLAPAAQTFLQPNPAPLISLGARPIIQLAAATDPWAAPAAPSVGPQLAAVPNITQAELAALGRLSPAAWTRILQYAAANQNPFSVKGKIAEELYLTSPAAVGRRDQVNDLATALGIASDQVQFSQDVRGQTPSRTSAGGSGELTDGIFFATRNGFLYILGVIESKSPSNRGEITRKASDGASEHAGQPAWDFERFREVPMTIAGQTFDPSRVLVSRRLTVWVGVVPQGTSFSAANMQHLRTQLPTIGIDNLDVRDSVLTDLARQIIRNLPQQ